MRERERDADAETLAEKNAGVQVVGSETIGEYRLMGFNDLRTPVRSDLGVSACISLYRPLADPVGTSRRLSIYPPNRSRPRRQYLERMNINRENENFPVCRERPIARSRRYKARIVINCAVSVSKLLSSLI